jgi:hypothetical protein
MKISIRDLLLVTVIVALAVGWWVEHCGRRMTEEEHKRLRLHAQELRDELRFAKLEYDDVSRDLAQEQLKRGITQHKRTGDIQSFREVKWKLADEPLPP